MIIDTHKIVEKLFDAVSSGKISNKEWKAATEALKIIKKVI